MALDKVQPLKLEAISAGGDSTDEFPTSLDPQHDYIEAMGLVIDTATDRDESTVINRLGPDMLFQDGNNPTPVTLTQLLATGGGVGLTSQQHKITRQLIHLADGAGGPFEGFTSGAVRVTTGGIFPTNLSWYTDGTYTKKIVEKQIAYNSNKTPSTIYWAVYATDGTTVLATAQDTITYSGIIETSRTRVISDTPAPDFITAEQHKKLRQLIHLADGSGGPFEGFTSGAYRETLGGVFPTSITWYEDVTKAKKVVDKVITYTSAKQVATTTWRVYDTDGATVLSTVSDTITYSAFFETSRTRSIV